MISHLRMFTACGAVSLLCGLAGGVIGSRLIGIRPVEDLKLRRMELVDGHGRTRATLRMNEDGEPGLDLLNEKGGTTASLGTSLEGGHLRLVGNQPESSAKIEFYHDRPSLAFSGDAWEGRVIVGYVQDDDTIPSEMGHWGLTVDGLQHLYSMSLGVAAFNGKDYDSFAVLPQSMT